MDEPTNLPEGFVLFLSVGSDDDDLDEAERLKLEASLSRGLADASAGRLIPAEKVLARLRRHRKPKKR